jgi:flavodoxin
MKKILLLGFLLSVFVFAHSAAHAAKGESNMPKKILIVYYSHSGNTKFVAQTIQKSVGGDIFEIETANPYPSEYKPLTEQAKKELTQNYRPPIKKNLPDVKNYDVIFLGSPNWWSTIAMPVFTFLSENDLSGKTVIPFITHGSGGMANTLADITKNAPKANIKNAKAFTGATVRDNVKEIEAWAKEAVK